MSENVNPLLFSASSSSIFDNLSSSAVLLPPQNNEANTAAPSSTSDPADQQRDSPSAPTFMPIATTVSSISSANQNPLNANQSLMSSVSNNGFSNTSSGVYSPSTVLPSSQLSPPTLPLSAPTLPQIAGPSLTTSHQTVTPTLTPRITPNITPSTTPIPTPSVTPRLPLSITPIPPTTFTPLPPPIPPTTFTPLPPPNFSSFPTMIPGGVPAPPPNFIPPSFGSAPPPPPPSTASPFMPVAGTQFSNPSPATTSFLPSNTLSHTNGLAAASTHPSSSSWTPPIYGESPVQETPVVPPSFENMATSGAVERYRPVLPHWFYAVPGKPVLWKPFSFTDSINLEEAHRQGGCGLVSTDGGRYDVEVSGRVRRPVYWESSEGDAVRRCSWYRKGALDLTPQPYEEEVAAKLEDVYRECVESGSWQRQVEVTGDSPGLVVLASPYSMHHYHTSINNAFPTSISIAESQAPDSVKRGANDFEMSDGEAEQVDHLLFLVHGIGPVCDLSFRSVEECVDTFRELGGELVSTHFHQSVESGLVGRVEVLPISWHKALHSDTDGIDQRLKPITLRSIPMLREFTNDTIVDVLLYTSPAYCQLIIDTVSGELNRLYRLFKKRNPEFRGGVSMAGHSLGSVILFDLLMHQKPLLPDPAPEQDVADRPSSSGDPAFEKKDGKQATFDLGGGREGEEGGEDGPGVEALQQRGVGSVLTASAIRARRSQVDLQESLTSSVNFEMGTAGTGQPSIAYPQLLFQPQSVFMLGSPIAMFLTVRGLTQLSPHYRLPTCPNVFNIFHPFDPVAYRLETLIHPHLTDLRPVLVPHHKGRKRMHLELKDTLERMGSDIKHRIVGSIQSIGNKLYTLYAGGPQQAGDDRGQQQQVEEAVEEELGRLRLEAERGVGEEGATAVEAAAVGQLNGGRRIDYVLQEKPYESLTEYIFALQAHLSYWKSEDTLLMMLKEIYGAMGITCDAKTANRTSAPTSNYTSATASPAFVPSPTAASPPTIPLMAAGEAPPAVPVYSVSGATAIHPALPPIPVAGGAVSSGVKLVGPRPVVDPSAIPQFMGMDPTAEPQQSGAALPPPPTGTKVNFSRKKGPRR